MNQLARNIACKWASDSIRIYSVCPWFMTTPLTNNVFGSYFQYVVNVVYISFFLNSLAVPEGLGPSRYSLWFVFLEDSCISMLVLNEYSISEFIIHFGHYLMVWFSISTCDAVSGLVWNSRTWSNYYFASAELLQRCNIDVHYTNDLWLFRTVVQFLDIYWKNYSSHATVRIDVERLLSSALVSKDGLFCYLRVNQTMQMSL